MKVASPADYRQIARKRLPTFLFEYLEGGANEEITLGRNVSDLRSVSLRQRVLRDASALDLSTKLFGQQLELPVILAPVGLGGFYARRGECAAARAAANVGIPFTLSTVSACSIEEVSAASSNPFWFQLYMIRDRDFMRSLLAKAKAAGCSALVFTVDMPVPGSRYRDYHSGLAGAQGVIGQMRRVWQAVNRPRWAWDVGIRGRPHSLGNVAPILGENSGIEDFFAWMRDNFDPTISWRDLDFVRENWDGPIILKGILDAVDAKEAANLGLDGIVVSNHGGRQLDGVVSTARALPSIVDKVGGDITVLADGGVRSGLDVVRMLALGADGVMMGRAWVYALASDGQAGIENLIELVAAEMRVAMTLTGASSIAQVSDTIAE